MKVILHGGHVDGREYETVEPALPHIIIGSWPPYTRWVYTRNEQGEYWFDQAMSDYWNPPVEDYEE